MHLSVLLLIHYLGVLLLLQNLQLRNLLRHLLNAMLGLHDTNLSLKHLLHLLASSLLSLLHLLIYGRLGLSLYI